MRLVRARIQNFRSIEDSGWVEVGDVACLVGKNESGKTNFLQALARMNPPAGESDAFDLTDDFPRRRLADIEAELKGEEAVSPVAVEVIYRLEDDDLRAVAERFGPDTLDVGEAPEIRVTKNYESRKVWFFKTDEAAAVRHIAQRHGVTGAPASASTVRAFREAVEAVEDPDPTVIAALAELDAWGTGGMRALIRRIFEAREPVFAYYSDYERMAGEGNVRELLGMRENRAGLDGPDRTFLALLDMAKADLVDLDEGKYNALKARLEAASIKISEELYGFWRQNTNSEIEIDHDYEQAPGHPVRNDLILKVRVRDKRHALSVPVDQRSNGFVWFFSFLVNFSRIQDAYPDHPLVLLLDEPGTALHGLAQQDFLRVIDERLSDHQVLYTTHQPFLVDPNRLDRARPVEDDPDRGTLVSNDPYRVHADTLFPLQAALGYEIGQTLFVAPNVLLVEGTSDLVYLQVMSRAVEVAGHAGLDRRWTITPVGGVDKMDTFIRLFAANHLNTCALVDVTGNKKMKVDRLVDRGDLRPEQVIRLSEFVKADAADIEDLFDAKFYVQIVRGSAKENPMMGVVTVEALPDIDDPRITRRIDALLKTLQQPRLDHLPPAKYLEAHQDDLRGKIPKTTLERFARLFAEINAQLTK